MVAKINAGPTDGFAAIGKSSMNTALSKYKLNSLDTETKSPVKEKTLEENLGPSSAYSTIRKSRGLLSNVGSETLG